MSWLSTPQATSTASTCGTKATPRSNVAKDLQERVFTQPQVSQLHLLMGLWTDAARNTYVAVYGARVVKKVSPRGQVQIAARSRFPWSPTGGFIAPNGDLWLLECSYTNAVRVRRLCNER